MTPIGAVALAIFVLGYVGITFEHICKVNKAAFALLSGTVLWILIGMLQPHMLDEHIIEAGFDIFGVTIFLLGAMALVEILIHYRIFDIIRDRIMAHRLSMRGQFYVMATIGFGLSVFVANMVATIIMIQIARRFFWGKNLLVAAVGIVLTTNAAGAFSPIGDVTTIMLWIAGKFSVGELVLQAALPALAIALVATLMLSRHIQNELSTHPEVVPEERLTRGEALIILTACISFLFPVVANMAHVPPVIGMLFGVGLTWLVVDIVRSRSRCRTHLTVSIEHLVQKTDIASIKFFVGILLSVSALSTLGVLEYISTYVYGTVQTTAAVIRGNIIIGLVSALLDNIPLTAIAIDMLKTTTVSHWTLLALTVGTGGSLLPIGSAAGVVAMGMLRELTFSTYVRIAFLPALISFFVGVGVWGLQTFGF